LRPTDAARRQYEIVLGVYRELGSLEGIAATLANLGLVHLDRGDLDSALELMEQARASYTSSATSTGR